MENRWSWESVLLSAGLGSFTQKVLRAVGDGGRDDNESGGDGLFFREPARSIEEVVKPEGFAAKV